MLITFVALSAVISASPPPAAFAAERVAFTSRRALERAVPRQNFGPFDGVQPPALDYQRFDVELTWDFRTGEVQGQGTLVVRAHSAASVVPLLLDSGVSLFSASDSSGLLSISRQPVGGDVDLVSIEVGVGSDEVTLQLSWAGTLRCGPGLGYPRCTRGATSFAWLDQGSGLPQPIDPVVGISTDRAHRTWVLHTPAGFTVQAAGDLTAETEALGVRTTRWTTQQPVALALAAWVLTGTALVRTPTAVAASPVVHAASSQQQAVAEFAQNILPREARLGPHLSKGVAQGVVPRGTGFIGTASYGMSLVNELYDSLGPLHEEIWAHENIHQHFAVRAYPKDQSVSALMTEGITTLLQLDYTHRALVGLERDLAMASRLRELGLQMEYRFPQVLTLPLALPDAAQLPDDPYVYNVWGYFKGASTHELLREWVGDTAFEDALRSYLRACDAAPCDNDVFLSSVEATSGKPMRAFFDRFVFGAARVTVRVGFEPRGLEGVDVTLEQQDAGFLPLELWVLGQEGQLRRELIELGAARRTVRLQPGFAVKAVRVNPRAEAIVKVDSAVTGDVDFDGEVDGFDVISCARLEGQSLGSPLHKPSLWATNLDFDRRCDRDHDGAITAADVDSLPFGTLRSTP